MPLIVSIKRKLWDNRRLESEVDYCTTAVRGKYVWNVNEIIVRERRKYKQKWPSCLRNLVHQAFVESESVEARSTWLRTIADS